MNKKVQGLQIPEQNPISSGKLTSRLFVPIETVTLLKVVFFTERKK